VGKTVVAGAIAAALVARGQRVRAFKPALTGTDEPRDAAWPPDDELLGAATGQDAHTVAPYRFGPPVSPHLAAELAGAAIDPATLVATARSAAAGADALVVEGVGGLLVPLASGYLVRDFARALALPVLIAARAGLGTINHTLLTLESARAAGLRVAGVVLTPWPGEPGALEVSNRATVAALGDVDVATLPALPDATRPSLVGAGAALPLDDWLGRDEM
jgi:dethiobiotin synthetase